MRNHNTPERHPALTWTLALVFGIVGIVVTFIGINLLGFLFFAWWVPSFNVAQGLGSALVFLSIPICPLGAVYWIIWGGLASSSKDGGPSIIGSWGLFLGLLAGITGLIGLLFG